MTIVSGITVKINPLPNNDSFSAIAPTAATPMRDSAHAAANALPTKTSAAATPIKPAPSTAIFIHPPFVLFCQTVYILFLLHEKTWSKTQRNANECHARTDQ